MARFSLDTVRKNYERHQKIGGFMGLRITIDVFSGRPNPIVELEGKQAKDALARLRPSRRLTRSEAVSVPTSFLGYRGLIIEQTGPKDRKLPSVFRLAHGDLTGAKLAHKVEDETFENFIASKAAGLKAQMLGRDFPDLLKQEIARSLTARQPMRAGRSGSRGRIACRCAPLYEPSWWNDGAQKQHQNNCYNYATNYRTDTFRMIPGGGQPGAAAGAMYDPNNLVCSEITTAAIADGLIASPRANNKCPTEGHLVAHVIAPRWPDFHWYRKGRDGYWTHKPGTTAATNLDNSGALISDPRTADRGAYTDFCIFMVVMHGHIKVR